MFRIAYIILIFFILASCKQKSRTILPDDFVYMDFITVLDNGIKYTDTTKWEMATGVLNLTESFPSDTLSEPNESDKEKKDESVIGSGFKCWINKSRNKTYFTLYSIDTSSTFPVSIIISEAVRFQGVIGVYKSNNNLNLNIRKANYGHNSIYRYFPKITGDAFIEIFKGAQKYSVDSTMVNISKAKGTTIEGNFKLWLSNQAGSKVVTGIFKNNKTIIM